jgi:hypothetical protein
LDTAQSILPKQATPCISCVGSGGVDLSTYTGKINIAFSTLFRKKSGFRRSFQVDDVQVLVSKGFKK